MVSWGTADQWNRINTNRVARLRPTDRPRMLSFEDRWAFLGWMDRQQEDLRVVRELTLPWNERYHVWVKVARSI